ncbi:VENN motif pre-toxin domain-containing protein, partial [Cronobacter dublinensis]
MLKLKKILSPEKNRERARSKTVYIVRDWGRILLQQSGERELARDIVESLAGNLMTKNWRVDYDPQIGVYINIWNYTKGKGIG